MLPTPPSAAPVISVSELNRQARFALEKGLPLCWVAGEISNFTRAASGHWYFTLKDAQAGVRCAMFRGRNQFVDWTPRDGDRIEVRAQATLYEARGEYQLVVEAVRRAGQGDLYERFLRLKARLEAEGLFDPARKRALPRFPVSIGVVTSPKAAALRDVLTTLKRRWPAARVVLYPCPVQGEAAPPRIVEAIDQAGSRGECDVLLVVRGGGSLEDLWAFNDEAVARAVQRCPIPVVSGVGHETDFSICDFVADLRAPTPTAAAEAVAPDRAEWRLHLARETRQLRLSAQRRLDGLAQRLDLLWHRLVHPRQRLNAHRQHLGHLARRLSQIMATGQRDLRQRQQGLAARLGLAWRREHQTRAQRLNGLTQALRHLDPGEVLQRGYSLVRDGRGNIVRSSQTVREGERIDITLAQGRLGATVTERPL
ncbi:MAG: exodeoxyribonuclease VII large subunit [Betaproteobacteria bacterium]|nr:exodeoxyribonuclease VII large subunit [Betaproteobacteria bacterium]